MFNNGSLELVGAGSSTPPKSSRSSGTATFPPTSPLQGSSLYLDFTATSEDKAKDYSTSIKAHLYWSPQSIPAPSGLRDPHSP